MAVGDMIADMEAKKKLSPIDTELFFKLNVSLVFISQPYFKVPKTTRLNATYYFIMKIRNQRELQQIASNDSYDIEFKDFMKLYKDCTKKLFSLLVNDATLLSIINPLRYRKRYQKITVIRKIKTIDNKIEQSKDQYN